MTVEHIPSLSMVIPCHNEQDVIASSCERLQGLIARWPAGLVSDVEYVLVNNGSTDRTLDVMREYQKTHPEVVIVDLGANYGYQGSITAGLHHARHDMVVTIDADLQDDPEKIQDMIQKYKQGYELVLGVREDRSSDSWFKRLTAGCYYGLLRRMGVQTVAHHGDFRLMSRRLVNEYKKLPERHRYIRSLVLELESRYATVSYKRTPRRAGRTKFNLMSLVVLAIDGITSFTSFPIRLVTFSGLIMFFFSIVMVFYVLYIKFIALRGVPGWAFLAMLFLFFGGLQSLSLGIIGEYIAKMYIETKRRPVFTVRRIYRAGSASDQ